MFGNLKNKLEGVADLKKYAAPQNLANSLMGSRQRSGSQTPSVPASPAVPLNLNASGGDNTRPSQSQANGNRKGAPSSLPSISHSPLSTASSRSHSREASLTSLPLSPGLSPTPSIDGKDAPMKVSSPTSTLPPTPTKQQDALTREVEKLRATLEQQQDAHLARLAAKDAEWRDKFARHADKVSETQEALQKSEITIASLRQELSTSKERNEELAKRLQDVQDDCDELEGLSVQEAAKIKHMLLNTSTELESARCQLRERAVTQAALEAEMQTTQHKSKQQISQLKQKVEHLQQEVRSLEQCRQQQLRTSSDDTGLKELQQQHADREQALLDKAEEWRGRCSSLEAQLSAEQSARQEEQQAQQQHLQQCGPLLEQERTQHSAALATLQTQHEGEIAALQDRLSKEKEKANQRITEEKERRQNDVAEEKAKFEKKLKQLEEEWQKKENNLMEEAARLRAELEDSREQKRLAVEELEQKLAASVSRREEAAKQLEDARGALQAAEQRMQQLQQQLDDLQQQKQAQISAEKAKTERLQSALSAERAEKQSLETAKLELENKQQVLASEKAKLSEHLDEFASKVTTLQGERDEQVLHTAQLRETMEQLQHQLKHSQEKAGEWESDALTSLQEEHASREQELQTAIQQLQEQLQEKQQALKVQNQRMADMKKTMQKELRISPDQQQQPSSEQSKGAVSPQPSRQQFLQQDPPLQQQQHQNNSHSAAVLPASNHHVARCTEVPAITKDGPIDPINLEYLKHVVLKFITSREYEAIHLTKAVSTLLHLTPVEERLVQDTLNWRMSWFGPRPQLAGEKMPK